jgi:hypothetical protein
VLGSSSDDNRLDFPRATTLVAEGFGSPDAKQRCGQMTEYPQQHSLLLSGADDELVRLGSYGSVSQDHAIQVVPEEKPHSETVPGAGAATREFPWLQTTLIFSALVGLALVVLVFAHDTDPWHDFLSRGKKVVLIDLSVAFVFFAASDVIAQIIPVINQRNGRGDSRRLLRHHEAISYTRAARCGVLGVFMNGFGYWAWVHALNILIPQQEVDSNVDDLQAFGLLIGKSLLDSCLWGTTANTVGILGKPLRQLRVCARMSMHSAHHISNASSAHHT